MSLRGCLLALVVIALLVVIANVLMGPRLDDADIHREIAKSENVELNQASILDWQVGDGWSDGAEVEVTYRLCRKANQCLNKRIESAFQRKASGRWEMIYHKELGGRSPG